MWGTHWRRTKSPHPAVNVSQRLKKNKKHNPIYTFTLVPKDLAENKMGVSAMNQRETATKTQHTLYEQWKNHQLNKAARHQTKLIVRKAHEKAVSAGLGARYKKVPKSSVGLWTVARRHGFDSRDRFKPNCRCRPTKASTPGRVQIKSRAGKNTAQILVPGSAEVWAPIRVRLRSAMNRKTFRQ